FRAWLERSAAGRRVNDMIDAADAAVIVAGSALAGQLRDGIDAVREMHNRKQDFRETMRQDAKYTREAIDPATGREYTVDVYPDGQGQKVNVRDNEAGTVIQPGMPETIGVTMDEGKRSVETEVTESL